MKKQSTWAKMVRRLEDSGLSQRAIADAIGLSPGALNDLVMDRTKQPRGDAAIKLNDLYRERVQA